MNSSARSCVLAAGLLGFTGVALGAFGAHALKETLTASGSTSTWQTAVLYHLLHSVALLGLAGLAGPAATLAWVRRLWLTGVLLFSGSLYWLALGGPKILGPITPLGGVALLAGWALLAWTAFRKPAE